MTATGLRPAPQSWPLYERCLRDVREQLSAASFERAWAAGRGLTDDEALHAALAIGPSPPTTPSPPVPPATTPPVVRSRVRAPHQLTERQRAVAALVAQGLTNREIANKLKRSERTVDAHVQAILERLDFASRAQIATWVTERSRQG